MLGVSGATISSIENGDSWMRLPMVAKVCEIGNVSPNWILTGREQIDRATPQPDEGDEQELLRLYRELDEDARKALLTLLKKTIKS